MSQSTHVAALRPRAPMATVQGTLALDLEALLTPPPLPPSEPAAVVAIDRRARREAERWAHRYAQAAVEIVGGDRPVSQLLRWSSGEVYADLARRALLVARAGAHQPGEARVQPVRPQVLSTHGSFVRPGVLEASVHVRYGQRSRALAARFELRRGRWVCTALDFA